MAVIRVAFPPSVVAYSSRLPVRAFSILWQALERCANLRRNGVFVIIYVGLQSSRERKDSRNPEACRILCVPLRDRARPDVPRVGLFPIARYSALRSTQWNHGTGVDPIQPHKPNPNSDRNPETKLVKNAATPRLHREYYICGSVGA